MVVVRRLAQYHFRYGVSTWAVGVRSCGELPIVGEYRSVAFRTLAKRLGLVKLVICLLCTEYVLYTHTLHYRLLLLYSFEYRVTIVIALSRYSIGAKTST